MVGPGQDDPMNDAGTPADTPRLGRPAGKQRRLSDHILVAVHSACDQGDLEVADRLIGILECMVLRASPVGMTGRRSDIPPLVAALERLSALLHPEARDG
jgi:hypothetical protein